MVVAVAIAVDVRLSGLIPSFPRCLSFLGATDLQCYVRDGGGRREGKKYRDIEGRLGRFEEWGRTKE
ncbi:hypothetical protein L2E82_10618 [Cichorium intybus]|uniref:Uncharacterized protein n=1 Tax=Cichorium intybus TaxID=13427 RepID=A0ACB9GC47_CICIN|nr:hypothetical protein L2E82_10618 [Cichorium intybus]